MRAQGRGLRSVVRERGHAVAGGRGGICDGVPLHRRRQTVRPLYLNLCGGRRRPLKTDAAGLPRGAGEPQAGWSRHIVGPVKVRFDGIVDGEAVRVLDAKIICFTIKNIR